MKRSHHSLRIIGGQWRGRRISFAATPGLRPTSDRLRETLFNWLQPKIVGARCLDLFAGSGILGMEAESRGAASVVWVEKNKQAVMSLKQQLQPLDSQGQVVHADALKWLATLKTPVPFDIIFLDPPFQAKLLEMSYHLLNQHGWLKSDTYLYVEQSALEIIKLPPHWQVWRHGKTGQVSCQLLRQHLNH